MIHGKIILLIVTIVFLSGCATNSTIFFAPLDRAEIEGLINNSPHVKFLTEATYEVTVSSNEVKLYYKIFHMLNRPDAIFNWEYYYVLGEGSTPKYDYTKIAEIEVYLPAPDDNKGQDELKLVASNIGATGLIDVYKKPLTSPGTTRQVSFNTYERPIEGYLYYGIAIKEK